MNKIQKVCLTASAAVGGVFLAFSSFASMITLPSYSDLVNTTTTSFGGSLLTDLIPIAGYLTIITIIGLILAAIVRRVLGGLKRLTGGGRRRGGRRGRR